jgi:hypothetical protein
MKDFLLIIVIISSVFFNLIAQGIGDSVFSQRQLDYVYNFVLRDALNLGYSDLFRENLIENTFDLDSACINIFTGDYKRYNSRSFVGKIMNNSDFTLYQEVNLDSLNLNLQFNTQTCKQDPGHIISNCYKNECLASFGVSNIYIFDSVFHVLVLMNPKPCYHHGDQQRIIYEFRRAPQNDLITFMKRLDYSYRDYNTLRVYYYYRGFWVDET